MSLKKKLAQLFMCVVLHAGAFAGVPMDPEQIRKQLELMSRTRIVQVVKNDDPPS